MRSSVLILQRAARRRLQRIVRKPRDAEQVRRATALLHLEQSGSVLHTAAFVAAARSSVYRWIGWFETDDVEGLRSVTCGCPVAATSLARVEVLATWPSGSRSVMTSGCPSRSATCTSTGARGAASRRSAPCSPRHGRRPGYGATL